jgi:hypothetical protein
MFSEQIIGEQSFSRPSPRSEDYKNAGQQSFGQQSPRSTANKSASK